MGGIGIIFVVATKHSNRCNMANELPVDENDSTKNCSKVKVICLGDSAVGKSKLVERYLLDGYKALPSSTFALQLYNHKTKVNGVDLSVDIWDTAGQEMFEPLHPSYYHQAHACILVFDATRKITYRNLASWYEELRKYRPNIPVMCAANKIDANKEATEKKFAFPAKHNLPLYYVSASDGTNVVRLFEDAIKAAWSYKTECQTTEDHILDELEKI